MYENDTGEHILRTLKESKKSNKKQTNKKERKKRKQIFKKKKEGKAEIRESVDHK